MKRIRFSTLCFTLLLLLGLLVGCGGEEAGADTKFDGMWLELDAVGEVWVISGDSLQIYECGSDGKYALQENPMYDDGMGHRLPVKTTFKDGVVKRSFDGTLWKTKSVLSIKGDILTARTLATMLSGLIYTDSTEYVRLDTPVSELKRICWSKDKVWQKGRWITEDGRYTFSVSHQSYQHDQVGSYHITTTSDDAVRYELNSMLYLYANGYMVVSNDMIGNDNPSPHTFVLLNYTMEGDRLTISGLDQLTARIYDHRENEDLPDISYGLFPISELTFIAKAG